MKIETIMASSYFSKIALLFLLALGFSLLAQNESKIETSSIYLNETDNLVSIKKIMVLSSTDNANGIYSKPIHDSLLSQLKQKHRFQLISAEGVRLTDPSLDLEKNPNQLLEALQSVDVDGVLTTQISKSNSGVSLTLSLFLKKDGKLFAQERVTESKDTSISNIQRLSEQTLDKVIKAIPYDGNVLSRTGPLVTLDLGRRDGISKGQLLTASIVIGIQRHPKLNFIISSEKEVLGKIRVEKVDESLSFGKIVSEKEVGVIQKNTKISGVSFVQYSDDLQSVPQKATQDPIAYGENPTEWRPSAPPTFGKVGLSLGIGNMRYNTKLKSAGALNGESKLFPSLLLTGQLWFTQNLIADLEIEQGIVSIKNPMAGSSPGSLSANTSNYSLAFGYKFLIQDDFFGPSILTSLGYAVYRTDVDSSSPLGLTSTRYKGIFLGISGMLPVSQDKRWNAGVALKYFLNSNLSESPQASSGPKNTITKFSILGHYQKNSRLRFTGALDFSLFSTDFSGGGSRPDPAETASQKYTLLRGGIEYLF